MQRHSKTATHRLKAGDTATADELVVAAAGPVVAEVVEPVLWYVWLTAEPVDVDAAP